MSRCCIWEGLLYSKRLSLLNVPASCTTIHGSSFWAGYTLACSWSYIQRANCWHLSAIHPNIGYAHMYTHTQRYTAGYSLKIMQHELSPLVSLTPLLPLEGKDAILWKTKAHCSTFTKAQAGNNVPMSVKHGKKFWWQLLLLGIQHSLALTIEKQSNKL